MENAADTTKTAPVTNLQVKITMKCGIKVPLLSENVIHSVSVTFSFQKQLEDQLLVSSKVPENAVY